MKLKFCAIQTKGNYIYELTPRGIRAKALTVSFLERKRLEYQDLKLEIERLENEIRALMKPTSPTIMGKLCEPC